jgi:putative endopeptidase
MSIRRVVARFVVFAALAAVVAAQGAMKSGIDRAQFDAAVRPQDDLFRHVNGAWLANTPLPPDRASYGTLTELSDRAEANLHTLVDGLVAQKARRAGAPEQQIADLYASFMDEAAVNRLGAAPLAPRLAAIDAVKTPTDLAALLGSLAMQGLDGFVGDYVQADKGDPAKNMLYLEQAGLALPDRDYYLQDTPQFADVRTRYEQYLEKIFTLAGRPNAAGDAKAVLGLETDLAKVQWTSVESRDTVKTYNKMPASRLVQDMPGFDWAAWARPQHLDLNVEWIVDQPSFFKSAAAMVPATPLSTWKAWLAAQLLTHDAPYLSQPFYDAYFDFYGRTLNGQQQPRLRWKRGIQLVNGALGQPLGRLFVDRYFPADSKVRMQRLVTNLLEAYRRSISTLDWMTPPTRQQALAKLAKFGTKIGYPSKWRDYSRLQIRAGDLLGDIERATTFEAEYQLGKLHRPVDREEWLMTPQTVNAYYNELQNEIVFPAAILQPPLFDPTVDDAANYGAIGAVIGHEIGHGFDDQGRKYDGDGRLHDWWTPEDAKEFEKRTQLLVDQYNAYSPLPGLHVNGELTLGENIGDLGGLSIGYQAWKIALGGQPSPIIDGLTGDQRFFFAWAQAWRAKASDAYLRRQVLADPHAWNEFRANGPPSNMQAFYDAFHLQPGDKLYREPAMRVRIW